MSSDSSHPVGEKLQQEYEIRPDVQALTGHSDPSRNSKTGVDYDPNPEKSLKVEQKYQDIVDAITRLYSGSASEEDMQVYARESVYDDPWSYCDSRYKIAGQWYGIPKLFAKSQTLATEIVSCVPPSSTSKTSDTPTDGARSKGEIIFKLKQEYTPKLLHTSKVVNSLITLSLDDDCKVKYHKDQWNEKDYSHEGLGKIFKTLNGDYLPYITQPPKTL